MAELIDIIFQFPNGFSLKIKDMKVIFEYFFQFPNGFSQYLDELITEYNVNIFQFPNGFSLKPYIPVPLSGCVHLALSLRVI